MSKENKVIVRRGIEEIWNQGNRAVVEEILATNYLRHESNSSDMRGLEVMKQWSMSEVVVGWYPSWRTSPDAQRVTGGGGGSGGAPRRTFSSQSA